MHNVQQEAYNSAHDAGSEKFGADKPAPKADVAVKPAPKMKLKFSQIARASITPIKKSDLDFSFDSLPVGKLSWHPSYASGKPDDMNPPEDDDQPDGCPAPVTKSASATGTDAGCIVS